jgi:excisionase family DNA binding protein
MNPDTMLEAHHRSLNHPLSTAEVAARLSLSESYLRKKIRDGRLIADREGKIQERDLADYLKACRSNAA